MGAGPLAAGAPVDVFPQRRSRADASGRACATHHAMLLDEPLTGIDSRRKDRILPYLLRIRRELHVPMV